MNKTIFKINIIIFILFLSNCEKKVWDNPYDSECPPSKYTPTGLTAEQIKNSTIELSWTATVTNIDGFYIDRKDDISNWTTVSNLINSDTYLWLDTVFLPSTKYYYRIYAVAGDNISDYCIDSISTKDGLPSGMTITEISDITATTAKSGGEITDNGGFSITARGVCWSTNSNPTIEDNKTNDSTGIGSFVSTLPDLSINTTYFVRAYATNSMGTKYSSEVVFTTLDGIPTLTTNSISEITATTAISGGNISADGGLTITARGVCWSTNSNPTIADNKTNDGTGIGSFTSSLTGLSANTEYYVRSYATNSIGTTYGNEVFFTNRPPSVTNPKTGKIWMDRNLGATQVATNWNDANSYGDLYQWGRGTDGHQIRTSGITTTLSSTDTPGNAYFIVSSSSPNDWRSSQNDNLWQGVSGTNNPCPSGYRLPTETELNNERLNWSTNDLSGAYASPLKFTVAGTRDYSSGSLQNVGSYGGYWSSTVDGTSSRFLRFYIGSIADFRSLIRAYGLSVRCIKD